MTSQVPSRDISHIPLESGETFSLGPVTIRVIEDGSHTDNRIGIAEFIIPPKTSGPPMHWHEMHDEVFLTTKGSVRFHVVGKPTLDSQPGEYIVVPVRAPHTFSNPSDEEARFLNTFTPAYYINYFRMLSKIVGGGTVVTPEMNVEAMAHFATLPVPKEYLEKAL